MNKEELMKEIEHIANCELYDTIGVEYLKVNIEKLFEENKQLKEENERLIKTYKSLIRRQYELGNNEFARYLQAQICDCNTFVPQELEKGDYNETIY